MTEAQEPREGEWQPCFVLPGLRLRTPVEAAPLVLVPYDDQRTLELRNSIPNLATFIDRFSDPFGVPVRPAMLLVSSKAPRRYFDVECIANFRNAVSIAVTCYNRALELTDPHGNRILYGDSFAIYPWALTTNGKYLVCSTPATEALHVVEKFHGQPSAAIPFLEFNNNVTDEPLLEGLLARWQVAYLNEQADWSDIALLRSLNMAYHASLIPAARDYTLYDIGRTVALWVSAFEILIHPGTGGEANRDRVVDLLERAPWKLEGCAEAIYAVKSRNKEHKTKLGSWLYCKLNACRNDFLHGNPVSVSSLELATKGRFIHHYAAPLYRMALTAFLDLAFRDPEPAEEDEDAQKNYASRSTKFKFRQYYIEKAILSAIQPRHDEDDEADSVD